jgi:hypothetical protein
MKPKTNNSLPECQCGCKDFEVHSSNRTIAGRYEYQLACRKCKSTLAVGKSTYALFNYLHGNRHVSDQFLKLYDLEQNNGR